MITIVSSYLYETTGTPGRCLATAPTLATTNGPS